MSADTTVTFEPGPAVARRTLLLGTRLMLAANTMLFGAMIFAYLYLRGNNFNGGWRPAGIDDLSGGPMGIILVLQLAGLVALVLALGAAQRGVSYRAVGAVAAFLVFASAGARVWYQYNLGNGWTINNGTYTAVTEMWFGILFVEIGISFFWLLSVVLPGPRSASPVIGARHLRAFTEFWAYMLVASTFVFLLVRLVS